MGFDKYMDEDILNKFEFYNYGHALEILHDAFEEEWKELQDCFRRLKLTLADIKKQEEMNHPYQKNLMKYYILMGGEKLESAVI